MTGWKYVVFLVITIMVYAGLLFWSFRRFLCFLPLAPHRRRWILGALIALYPCIYFLRRVDRVIRFAYLENILTGLYVVAAFFIILAFLIFVRDLLWWALLGFNRVCRKHPILPKTAEKRVQFLQYSTLAVVMIAAVLLLIGIYQAFSPLIVRRVTLYDPRLPPHLDGLQIAVVGDLHIGPTLKGAHVKRVVQLLNAQNADLVVIVGDLVDGPWNVVRPMLTPLAQLKQPAYFVSGNHELYWGWPNWRSELSKLGITVLSNDFHILKRGHSHWMLGGIPDRQRWSTGYSARDPGPAWSLRDAPPVDYRILLAHRPTTALAAEKAGYQMMISGHNHGGQFFPFTWIFPLFFGGKAGFWCHGSLFVFVTTGAGFWGPPVRLWNSSEIVVLTLRVGKKGQGCQ